MKTGKVTISQGLIIFITLTALWQPRKKSLRSSFHLKQGWEIINPSRGYPANIHRMRSADLIRFLANERRNIKRGQITVKSTRGLRNFLHIILCRLRQNYWTFNAFADFFSFQLISLKEGIYQLIGERF